MLELRGASAFKSNALNLQIRKEAQRGALADLRPYDADMYYLLEPNNLHSLYSLDTECFSLLFPSGEKNQLE